MDGLVKRNKFSIPFLSSFPKMTTEYKLAMDDLFFSNSIAPSDVRPGDVVIALGSPIMIKEQVETISRMPLHDKKNVLILSGGPSPAYKKLSLEFIGAAVIEMFKGSFRFDFRRKSEAVRVNDQLLKKHPGLGRKLILGEDRSSNAYEAVNNSYNSFRNMCKTPVKRWVIASTIEELPRAIATFRHVAGENVEIVGLPYNPWVERTWDKSLWWRSRFAAEVSRIQKYSYFNEADKIVKEMDDKCHYKAKHKDSSNGFVPIKRFGISNSLRIELENIRKLER